MDEEFLLKWRHLRFYKPDYFIPIRTQVRTLDYLRELDRRIKPTVIFYTQGRFMFPERLSSKDKKGAGYFLYQDYIIVDVDEWAPDDILKLFNIDHKYIAFTGSGFHLCVPRPHFPDEDVLDPLKREEMVAKNNAYFIERMANEHGINVDVLPEPRQLFKIPASFEYGNKMVKVFDYQPTRAELEELSRSRTGWRAKKKEKKEKTTVRALAFSNNVKGTRGYVLIAYVSKSLAERMVERYNLKASFYVENGIKDYLLDIQVVPKERIIKILRRENSQSLRTFLKYKHLLGIVKGSASVLNLKADKSLLSRGHASLLRWGNIDVDGEVGERKVDLYLVEIEKA
jgi:hypothetical protein